MNELNLFTGSGGGLLGSLLLGWRTIGYVEWSKYCQRVLRQRIEDGLIHNAPIFGDIRAFIREGYARRYRGLVNVLSAGFPCQPFSVAGKQLAENDERNRWPETRDCIDLVRPEYAWLENVPGLLSSGYFGTVLGDLSEIGYSARWCVLSAADVGAPHKRDRLWILAYSTKQGLQKWSSEENKPVRLSEQSQLLCADVSDSNSKRELQPQGSEQNKWGWVGNVCEDVSDTCGTGCEKQYTANQSEESRYCSRSTIAQRGITWWSTESGLGRVANGVAKRVDRLKAIGNGQVPAVVATAWNILSEGLL